MSIDKIFFNAKVHTQDPANPSCSAVAIMGSKIFAAGSDKAILDLADKSTEKINLNGRCVLPGLVDSHLHFESYALGLQGIDLVDIADLEQTLAVVQEGAKTYQEDEWVEGRGWNQSLWPGGAFPTAWDLDQIEPNRPVLLGHRSGHAAWVNSKAIEISKLDKVSHDPKGGVIQRDDLGKPTGILFEKAMKLVSDCVPKPTVREISEAMINAQRYALRAGLTGVHDFDKRRCFLAFQELRRRGDLRIRVVKSIERKRLHHAVGVGLTTGFGDDWIRIGSLKLFADGALGPRTASMIDPYEGEDDNQGIIVIDKEEMFSLVSEASRQGISVAVHAIGDKANHDVLDVFEAVANDRDADKPEDHSKSSKLRHRIEHAQILHQSDLARFAELDVIASMQPIHATVDMEMAESHWGSRCEYSYAWRSLIDLGATMVYGSDAPVESIKPLDGIHAAVSRTREEASPESAGWIPKQRITVKEAVAGYTIGAAIASGREGYMGQIKAGFLADLTILDRDIFEINPQDIPSAGVAGTVVDGQIMYQNW